jgi:hypothetical protein
MIVQLNGSYSHPYKGGVPEGKVILNKPEAHYTLSLIQVLK